MHVDILRKIDYNRKRQEMTQMLDGDKLVKCIYIKKWSLKKKKKGWKDLNEFIQRVQRDF